MAQHHPSPPMPMHMHHGPPGPPPPPPGAPQNAQYAPSRQILTMNEAVWIQIGKYYLGAAQHRLETWLLTHTTPNRELLGTAGQSRRCHDGV